MNHWPWNVWNTTQCIDVSHFLSPLLSVGENVLHPEKCEFLRASRMMCDTFSTRSEICSALVLAIFILIALSSLLQINNMLICVTLHKNISSLSVHMSSGWTRSWNILHQSASAFTCTDHICEQKHDGKLLGDLWATIFVVVWNYEHT